MRTDAPPKLARASYPNSMTCHGHTVEEFEDAAWAAVLALGLGAGAAVLGGVLATREEISRVW